MFLNGTMQPADNDWQLRDRWTGQPLGRVPRDGAGEVDAAVRSVAEGRRPVKATARSRILLAVAGELERRTDEFARLITAESGVCRRETIREVARACANLRVAAIEAERIRGESILVPGQDRLAVTVPEPVGVVAGITPFNRPLNQVVVKVAPAVAAGCAVVLKPSEKTPLTALAFAEVLVGAGYPKEMFAVLTGEPEVVGQRLASHPLVDMVTFTGGVAAGRRVAAAAAGKKLLLELGGNDPLIVLADADLDAAAALAADGSFATAGQSCRGVKRIIVAEQVADAFVARLVAASRNKTYGDPHDPETHVGPLIDVAAANTVRARIDAAVGAGAQLLLGGEQDGALMTPTVLDRVPPDCELVRVETFGPVAPVLRVPDVDAAIELANSTPYGLQAGVVTRDTDAFWHIAGRLRVGAVNLGQGPQFDSPHIPFGGVKASGVGREGIRYAISEMSVVKTITVPYGG